MFPSTPTTLLKLMTLIKQIFNAIRTVSPLWTSSTGSRPLEVMHGISLWSGNINKRNDNWNVRSAKQMQQWRYFNDGRSNRESDVFDKQMEEKEAAEMES